MKKALLGGILVIGAGYVGSTMYFGSEAETQFKKSITVIDQALQKQMVDLPEGPTFQLSLKDYDKGLLNSSAKLKINLDFADMPTPIPMKNLTYDLNLNISHLHWGLSCPYLLQYWNFAFVQQAQFSCLNSMPVPSAAEFNHLHSSYSFFLLLCRSYIFHFLLS